MTAKRKTPPHFHRVRTCYDCKWCVVQTAPDGALGPYRCSRYRVELSDYEAECYRCDNLEESR